MLRCHLRYTLNTSPLEMQAFDRSSIPTTADMATVRLADDTSLAGHVAPSHEDAKRTKLKTTLSQNGSQPVANNMEWK